MTIRIGMIGIVQCRGSRPSIRDRCNRNSRIFRGGCELNQEEQGNARILRFTSWKEIEDSQADIRKKMTEKYRVDF